MSVKEQIEAIVGSSSEENPKRPNRAPLDSRPATPTVQKSGPTEDTFVPAAGPVDYNEPPKDPNAPSGSLSSDDAEAITVDFSVPDSRHPI
jgi:hypothetical protein